MIEMSNKRPPIAINKGKRKSLATLLFLLVSIEIILAIIKKITIKQPIIPAIRKVVKTALIIDHFCKEIDHLRH